MAKLSDLKDLWAREQARAPQPAPAKPVAPGSPLAATAPAPHEIPPMRPTSVRRALAAGWPDAPLPR